jgi:hypothetical protein
MKIALILIGIVLILFALWMDILALIWGLRRNRTGRAPSGIPLIPIFLYVGGCALLPATLFGIRKGLVCLGLIVVHILFQYVIRGVDKLFIRNHTQQNEPPKTEV